MEEPIVAYAVLAVVVLLVVIVLTRRASPADETAGNKDTKFPGKRPPLQVRRCDGGLTADPLDIATSEAGLRHLIELAKVRQNKT